MDFLCFYRKGKLLEAAEQGNAAAVKILLESPSLDVNVKNTSNESILHLAVRGGHVDIIKQIFACERFTALNDENASEKTALLVAVEENKKDIVKILLDNVKVEVNRSETNIVKQPVWLAAAEKNHAEIVQLLLECERFKDFNAKNGSGETALAKTLLHGHEETFCVLLNCKKVEKQVNFITLSTAVVSGYSQQVIRLLGHAEYDINRKEALSTAVVSGYSQQVIRLLGHAEYDINRKEEDGTTLLMHFVHRHTCEECLDVVKAILDDQRFTELHALDKFGRSALYWAVHSTNESIAELVVKAVFKDSSKCKDLVRALVTLSQNGLHEFNTFIADLLPFAKKCPQMDWQTVLSCLDKNPLLSVIDVTCPNPEIQLATEMIRAAYQNPRNDHVVHLHLLCDTNVKIENAQQWIFKLIEHKFEAKVESSSSPILQSNTLNPTGIHSTVASFVCSDDVPKYAAPIIISHLYRGVEEFVAFHANRSPSDRGVYLIMLSEHAVCGSNSDEEVAKHLQTILQWRRLIYTTLHQIHNVNDSAATDASSDKIPMITFIDHPDAMESKEMMKPKLQALFSNHSNSLLNDFIASQNSSDAKKPLTTDERLVLEALLQESRVHGIHQHGALYEYVVSRLTSLELPELLSEEQWKHWLQNTVESSVLRSGFTHAQVVLSVDHQQAIISMLCKHCEDSLLLMNKVMMLKDSVNGFKVVINPSLVFSKFVGDLQGWFRQHGRGKKGALNVQGMKLTEESLIEKLTVFTNKSVVEAYQQVVSKGQRMVPLIEKAVTNLQNIAITKSQSRALLHSVVTATHKAVNLDREAKLIELQRENLEKQLAELKTNLPMTYFKNRDDGLTPFSLLELLKQLGLCFEVYNEHSKEQESWLLGLAPNYPTESNELTFDWKADFKIKSCFYVADPAACFIPGYFLRLFINMSVNKGYELQKVFGNDAKLRKTFNNANGSNCEVQIILQPMSDMDHDSFKVLIGGIGEDAEKQVKGALDALQGYILLDQGIGMISEINEEDCVFCFQSISPNALDAHHHTTCLNYPVRCNHPGCEVTVSRKLLNDHCRTCVNHPKVDNVQGRTPSAQQPASA